MGRIRRVGTTKNKDSEIINAQRNFMKRWDIVFDNNNTIQFRNRIITALRKICPEGESLIYFENDLFYRIGLAYINTSHVYSYNYDKSELLKRIAKLDLTQEKDLIKFFWWLENILNTKSTYIDTSYLADKISEALVASGLNAQLCKSGSTYMFYPAGAELLDVKVVNDVLNWLDGYPKAKEKFNSSLLMFQKKNEARHVLDNLRLGLELFLKEFFGNEKSLENQKDVTGQYLSQCNVPKEIRNLYFTLISHYNLYNNENVKHNDKCSSNEIEFIIYLTGTFIRFLIQTKANQKADI